MRDEEIRDVRLFEAVGKGITEVETIAECQAGPMEGNCVAHW